MTKTIYFGIYEVKNLINGKSYIGQSATNVHARCNSHNTATLRGADNKHLVRAVAKYGIENFSFKVILYCEEFELTRYEDALIKIDRPNRYNMRDAADSNKGIKYSEEVRHNMSVAHKGQSAWNKGIEFSAETIQRMSESHKVENLSAETRRKKSEAMMGTTRRVGKKASEETRHKLSKALVGNTNRMGHKHSELTKQRLSEMKKHRVTSEETKRKISTALLGNQRAKGKTWKVSEEAKHNRSEAQKRRQLREHDVWECT